MQSPGVIVGFVRGQALYSKLIALKGGWKYSHVTTLMPGGATVIDSVWHPLDTFKRKELQTGGVRERPVSYLKRSQVDWFKLPATEDQANAVYSALQSQIGKPYDSLGIRNFVTGGLSDRNFRNQSAWFCDELAVWSWERGNVIPTLLIPPSRIDPTGASLIAQTAFAVPVKFQQPRVRSHFGGFLPET